MGGTRTDARLQTRRRRDRFCVPSAWPAAAANARRHASASEAAVAAASFSQGRLVTQGLANCAVGAFRWLVGGACRGEAGGVCRRSLSRRPQRPGRRQRVLGGPGHLVSCSLGGGLGGGPSGRAGIWEFASFPLAVAGTWLHGGGCLAFGTVPITAQKETTHPHPQRPFQGGRNGGCASTNDIPETDCDFSRRDW